MNHSIQPFRNYRKFNSLAGDLISLAEEIMPNKVIYLNYLNDTEQVTLFVSKHQTNVKVEQDCVIPVDEAICNQVDYQNKVPLVFKDIRHETLPTKVQKTAQNLNLGAYLGIPITFNDGQRFGTLCVGDDQPNDFHDKQIKLLQKIANLFSYYLELEQMAYKDSLTNVYSARFFKSYFKQTQVTEGALFLMDLDGFKQINDRLGHYVGNLILQELGQKLNAFTHAYPKSISIRMGGDEFLIYIPGYFPKRELESVASKLVKNLSFWKTYELPQALTGSVGVVSFKDVTYEDLKDLLNKADLALYSAKSSGKNAYVIETAVE
ncbi:MAG: diguanylate cyclase [Acholeplasma sp.]|nr:diguanylate cyclase [Acholeplasma sp.]